MAARHNVLQCRFSNGTSSTPTPSDAVGSCHGRKTVAETRLASQVHQSTQGRLQSKIPVNVDWPMRYYHAWGKIFAQRRRIQAAIQSKRRSDEATVQRSEAQAVQRSCAANANIPEPIEALSSYPRGDKIRKESGSLTRWWHSSSDRLFPWLCSPIIPASLQR